MTIVASPVKAATIVDGDLIKTKTNSAVYYVQGGKRYVFPNENTYRTWFVNSAGKADFKSVTIKTVTDAEKNALTLAGNVRFRPGTAILKFSATDTDMYAVEPNGQLRLITEAQAATIYGTNWKNLVFVNSEFLVNDYTKGTALVAGTFPIGTVLNPTGTSDLFYWDGSAYRKFANDSALLANGMSFKYVVPTASAISATGTAIAGSESTLSNANMASAGGSVITPIIGGSGLTVALASDTPASTTYPKNATNVTFTKFNVTAAKDGDMTISSITVKRQGVGALTDISGVMLYDGLTRLTSSRSVASDTNNVEFATLNLKVPAGTTKTLSIVVNGSDSAAANHAFGVYAASDIKTTTGSVAGSFPIMGNTMTFNSSVSASTATIDHGSAAWNTKIGTVAAEVAKFTILAGTNDLSVKQITLRNGGNLSNSYIQNLILSVGSTQVATAVNMVGDKAILTLATPYTITKGVTKNFTLTADIKGGRTNDTVKFYLDETSDLAINDVTYGVGAKVTNTWTYDSQIVTMEGSDITMIDNGPVATTYSVNSTGKDLLNVGVTALRNVTVKKTKITITTGGNFAVADLAYLKNIRLVDTATGSTLVGPIATLSASNFLAVSDGTACDTEAHADAGCYAVMTDTFDLAAGTTRNVAVRADFDTSMTSGSTFTAAINWGVDATYIYDNDSGEYVTVAKVVPGSITGKAMTVNSSSVTVSKASTPTSATFVKGATVDAYGASFDTTAADSLKLTKFVARIYADASTTFTSGYTGDTAANTVVESASLYDGTTLVKGPVSLTQVGTAGGNTASDYSKAEFTGLSYSLPAGSSKKLTVQLKLRNTYSGNKYVTVNVNKSDLEVENSAGNLLTSLSGFVTALGAAPTPLITCAANGTLTIAVDGNTPTADLVLTGSSAVEVARYRLTAANEAFKVTGLKLTSVITGSRFADVSLVTLKYTNSAGVEVTKDVSLGSDGTATLADGQVDIYVPKGSSSIVKVYATTNTIALGATSNDSIQIGLTKAGNQFSTSNTLTDDFISYGVSSGTQVKGTAIAAFVDSSVVAQKIAKTRVSAVNNMATTVIGSQNSLDNVGIFKFTSSKESGSTQNSTLKTVTVKLTGTFIATGAGNGTATVKLCADSNCSLTIGSDTITTLDAGTSTAIAITASAYNEFDGDKVVYVQVDSTDSDFALGSAGTSKNLYATITTFSYDDGTTAGAATTPVIGIPLNGSTAQYQN